jgi:hypothetical protein
MWTCAKRNLLIYRSNGIELRDKRKSISRDVRRQTSCHSFRPETSIFPTLYLWCEQLCLRTVTEWFKSLESMGSNFPLSLSLSVPDWNATDGNKRWRNQRYQPLTRDSLSIRTSKKNALHLNSVSQHILSVALPSNGWCLLLTCSVMSQYSYLTTLSNQSK